MKNKNDLLKQSIEMEQDILNLIMQEPILFNNYNKVKFKKDFAKKWYEITSSVNFSKVEGYSILEQLLNYPPTLQYGKSYYYIPIYLPIKTEFLPIFKAHTNDMYLNINSSYGDTREKSRIVMFINFLNYLNFKKMNFLKYDINQNSLLGKLVSRLMQWNHKAFTSLVTKNGVLYDKINNASLEDTYNIINIIKNDWSKIWTNHIIEFQAHFINSGFCDPHAIFEVLEMTIKTLSPVNIPINFFDNDMKKIMIDLEEFAPHYNKAKEILNYLYYLELSSKTQYIPIGTINKKVKKI